MPSLLRLCLAAFVVSGAALAGCSPTFNWREVPIADGSLIALLPCKADRATRALPLGEVSITVHMTGCEAGGATFAVAHASAADAAQAEGWIRAWRAATKERLDGQAVVEAEVVVPRAARAPAPTRLDVRPEQAPSAAAGQTHVIWFAQQRAGGVFIYQATVLGNPSEQEAVKTFFEGLRLQ